MATTAEKIMLVLLNGLARWLFALFWAAPVVYFLGWLGTIRNSTAPLSLVEDPGAYRIKGDQVRPLIDGVLQAGDIVDASVGQPDRPARLTVVWSTPT